jgi:2-amino-4-hydroxy-6-hydroxymethyldihydropteridine diphosphokinase
MTPRSLAHEDSDANVLTEAATVGPCAVTMKQQAAVVRGRDEVSCLVGLGSNEGCPRQQTERAVEVLRFMPGIELLAVSRFRETRPIGGPPGQPAYVNGACLLRTALPPHDLLDLLAAVENSFHRQRTERWGPRSLDLDLLLYGDQILETDRLTLPHPRMATRRFVLEPAAEVAAHLVHPLVGCTVGELLEAISVRHLHIAVIGIPGSGSPEVAAAVADVTLSRLLHAPRPLPACGITGAAELTDWVEAACEVGRGLSTDHWPADLHGTVADHWLETYRLAATAELPTHLQSAFAAATDRCLARAAIPQVAVLLVVSPEVLAERIAFRSTAASASTDVFADLDPAGSCDRVRYTLDGLLRLQDMLIGATCGGSIRTGPRAVVRINADDLGRSTLEAVAAIEALT